MKNSTAKCEKQRLRLKRILPAVTFLTILSGCGGPSKTNAADPANAPIVAVALVKRTDLTRDLALAADFRPYQEIDVHAKLAGYVKAIYVDVGDRVKAGQLLATLEIPELQDEVHQAEAAVKQSEEEIKRAQGDLERAESAHQVAHLAYQRLAQVMQAQPNLVAQQEIDDSQGRDRQAEAQAAASKAALAAAQQQLEVSKANQERIRTLFAYSRIIAPFAGTITKRYADTGSMIQAGTSSQTQAMPLVTLSQNDLLRLVIPVPESIVSDIHLGGPVQVRVPALGKVFQGRVARFADQVDTATRTMHTEVNVPNPRLELVPGMYAYASLVLDRRHDALAVPVQAVNHSEDQATVFVVDAGNKIEERPVNLGMETPSEVEILSGLNESDRVVVGNRSQLQKGEVVRPKVVELAGSTGGN